MTPMKKVSSEFKVFNEKTKDSHKRLHLNYCKAQSAKYPYTLKGTKGVSSDSIFIYSNDNESIAFSFHGAKEDLVHITLKDDEVQHLALLSIEDFKLFMKELNQNISGTLKETIIELLKTKEDKYQKLSKTCLKDFTSLFKTSKTLHKKLEDLVNTYPLFLVLDVVHQNASAWEKKYKDFRTDYYEYLIKDVYKKEPTYSKNH